MASLFDSCAFLLGSNIVLPRSHFVPWFDMTVLAMPYKYCTVGSAENLPEALVGCHEDRDDLPCDRVTRPRPGSEARKASGSTAPVSCEGRAMKKGVLTYHS
jgi:hypothetical protein